MRPLEYFRAGLKGMSGSLTSFCHCERGSYFVFFALALIPVVGAAGLGIDLGRSYVAQSRLQAAIDSAAIAMASAEGTDSEIQTLGENFFYANFPSDFWAASAPPVITIDRPVTTTSGDFTIEARATVPTLFMGMFGHDSVQVAARTEAVSEIRGLEVVLVLDVTGSMYYNYNGGERRIEAMMDAAQVMMDILFGDQTNPDLLRVSLVPYIAAVNIGTANAAYVTDTDTALFGSTDWLGCVQARPNGHDLTDAFSAGATDGTGEWPAYRWPIEPNRRGNGDEVTECRNRAAESGGDYDSYNDPTWISLFQDTAGPNRSCPQPLLPLTNDRATVETYLANLSVVDTVGTVTATGMVWGWRALSPEPPFTEGVAYDDGDWQKVIIVLTDGQQELTQNGSNCDIATHTTPDPQTAWAFDPATRGMDGAVMNQGPDRNWTAYGYVHPNDSAPLGAGTITTILEDRLLDVCDNIKLVLNSDGDRAIDIFAITFGDHIFEGDSISTKMRNCTTDPSANYFHAPDPLTLNDAFEEIARQLSKVRLTG